MDYVKETLQRQNGLWLALFGGSEEIEAVESQREQTLRERAVAEQAALRLDNAYSSEKNEASPQERIGTRSEQELLMRGREMLLREQAFGHKEAAENGTDQTKNRLQRTETVDAEIARWEAEAALREGRSDLETADARAISRRFERDARRYDGGFVFY